MPIISAVGLFCSDKFEETPNEKVSNMSKLTKSYFSTGCECQIVSSAAFCQNLAKSYFSLLIENYFKVADKK